MLKSHLVIAIQNLVGPEKYGKKLWSLTNEQLEDILSQERDAALEDLFAAHGDDLR